MYHELLDRTEARGVGFSELQVIVIFIIYRSKNTSTLSVKHLKLNIFLHINFQSYWNIPFHDFAVVGDVCTTKDKHKRQLYDQIHVASSNPVKFLSSFYFNTLAFILPVPNGKKYCIGNIISRSCYIQ